MTMTRMKIAVALGDDIDDHNADPVLQKTGALDRKRLAMRGPILVRWADKLDCRDHSGAFLIVEYVDFE
jgi:hypothetical protein